LPVFSEYIERIRRDSVHFMVGPIHDESDAGCDHAEFTDDQFITKEIIMVLDVLFKVCHVLEIVIIGIIAHLNIWVGNDIFQETKPVVMRKGKFLVFVWYLHV